MEIFYQMICHNDRTSIKNAKIKQLLTIPLCVADKFSKPNPNLDQNNG